MFTLKRDAPTKELLGEDLQLGFGQYIEGPVAEHVGKVCYDN